MNLVVGTAGHIDHGKTALIRALTGIDTDRLPEEKRRGITIEPGFASCRIGGAELSFVDVPGHERFVRQMLAGIAGIDAVLLIVAADDSVMPQTQEHAEILRFAQVRAGIIAITKCDLVDATWLDLVEDEIRVFVAGTDLENAPIVRTSIVTGQGLDQLRDKLSSLKSRSDEANEADVFRLAIDRAFAISGHGTVVTGTIASGRVSVGDELELMPQGRRVRVRSIQRHEQILPSLGTGNRAALNLVGVHHTEVERGHELATPGYLAKSQCLTVELFAARFASTELRHKSRYRLHLGTSEVIASLSLWDGKPPTPDAPVYGQLRLAQPVVAVFGQPFVLRQESPSTTLAGGRVLEPNAQRIRRKQSMVVNLVHNLAQTDAGNRLACVVSLHGTTMPSGLELRGLTGLSQMEIEKQIEQIRERGEMIEIAAQGGHRSTWLPIAIVLGIEARITKNLARLHATLPRQSSIPIVNLIATLADLDNRPMVEAIIDRMAQAQTVLRQGLAIALATHQAKLSQAESKLKAEIAASLRAGNLMPPEPLSFVTASPQRTKQTVLELLTLLCEEQRLVKLDHALYLDAEAEQTLRDRRVRCGY